MDCQERDRDMESERRGIGRWKVTCRGIGRWKMTCRGIGRWKVKGGGLEDEKYQEGDRTTKCDRSEMESDKKGIGR